MPVGDFAPAKKLSMSASLAFLLSMLVAPMVRLPSRNGRRIRRVLIRISAFAVPVTVGQKLHAHVRTADIPSSEAVTLANTLAGNGTLIPDASVRLTMISGSSRML